MPGNKPQCFTGLGGAVCTQSEVAKATAQMNQLNDTSGWGNQVSAAITGARGNVRYACAAEHITGKAPCPNPGKK